MKLKMLSFKVDERLLDEFDSVLEAHNQDPLKGKITKTSYLTECIINFVKNGGGVSSGSKKDN